MIAIPGMNWLGGLGSDLAQIADRAMDRHLRVAVTGLRRSGKTVFITALVRHLLEGTGLPFLKVVHEGRYRGARLLPVPEAEAFPYQRFAADLSADPARWPDATERLTRLRLLLRFETANPLLRPVSPIQELTLDIIDYPGEWLLDLPLLEASFESLSQDALKLAGEPARAAIAEPWLRAIHGVDQGAPADPALLAGLAATFTEYLARAQTELGLSLIQPGRFIHQGDAAGDDALLWCPLPPAETAPGSLRMLAAARFKRYRDKIVRGFYEEHFRWFDRQVVLVDLLGALNRGPAHFADTQAALEVILESFRYGRSGLFARLFAPRIDRLVFAASKADHVAPSQHAALKQLLSIMVAPAARSARFEGLQPEVLALAALRSTDVVRSEHHGQMLSLIKGRLKDQQRDTALFTGEIPPDLPEPQDWDSGRFRFHEFAPGRLLPEANRHIRLDQAIEHLIGDKLR